MLKHLFLKPGMTVADVGAGTGFFSIPLAEKVGSAGTVYVVDLQQEMLDRLHEKLSREKVPRSVRLVRGDAARTTLPGKSCDLIFMGNVWHELDDWRPDIAPPPGPPREHRVAPQKVDDFLHSHGWRIVHSGNVARYSYLIVAERAGHESTT